MKLRTAFCALSALLAATTGAIGPTAAQTPKRCSVPDSVAALDEALPRFAEAWRGVGPLSIVAFGSSSTYGTGASSPERAYPAELERLLRAAMPHRRIAVTNAGVPGDDVAKMMARLERDVASRRPDLIIWQTGTNDILAGVPVERFIAQHREGVARLRALGADLLLVETQWFPRLIERPDYLRYIQALRDVADEADVPLVRRFDMMAWWAATEAMAPRAMLADDRFHMKDIAYRCLAEQIAAALSRVGSELTTFAGRPK